MTDDYKRCDTCIHCFCQGQDKWSCIGCPMWKTEDEIPHHGEGCGCVAYDYDYNGDCPFYEKDTEEYNG